MRSQMMMLRNLNCPNCAAKLQKAAQELPGMKEARVAFASGTLNVEYDPEKLSEGDIRNLVRRFGVDVASVLPAARS
ncbi:MAG TPA: cation transporter [Firmicutes bacterium]|nr:cation transporter [Bacillota bacterium]